MGNSLALWLRKRRGHGLAAVPPGRGRRRSQAGTTLIEISFIVGIVLLITGLALAMAGSWRTLLGLDREDHTVRQVAPQAAVLQEAVSDWFIHEHCSSQAPGPPQYPLSGLRAAPHADLKRYAADGAPYLDDPGTYGTYTGCVSRPSGPPYVTLYWEPPAHTIEIDANSARRLQADIAPCVTATCSLSTAASSCFRWNQKLALKHYGGQDGQMLKQWLERFGIDCDLDDDGTINSDGDMVDTDGDGTNDEHYCDSNDDGDLGPNAPDGYTYSSTYVYPTDCEKCLQDIDINATSTSDFDFLDFDSDNDFDVDAADYPHWGC